MDVFYCRYVADIVVLAKSQHQFAKAKKRLFKVLRQLKFEVSPQKTKMGKLSGFHFLGATFEVSQTLQSKNQVTTAMHNRSCRRALDKVKAMRESAVSAANIQRYLRRWGTCTLRAAGQRCPYSSNGQFTR
jgi:RNA-directed DNA polymerase